MPAVTVRYYAGARAAAGVDSEVLELPGRVTVADLLAEATARHGERLARVLAGCSFLLDETAVHERSAPVPDGASLDVLPPFAGG